MSKYRKFILFATTLVATLAFVFTGGVINAQKLTVSGIDKNGNVTSSKSYSEDGQDFYEVKIKANKKQAIYLLAGNDGNDPEHYSVIDKDKTNKKGKYTYNLASVNGEEAVYYISTDKSLKNKSKKATFNIDKIKNTKIVPYIYNMSEIMNSIDVIVSRSGAMTITEISLVGKPAIFIPLPSMSTNRQVDNAKVLEKLGAAKIILNEEVNSKNLSNTIDKLLQNPEELKQMGKRAKQIATYNVEEKIYDEIKKVVK